MRRIALFIALLLTACAQPTEGSKLTETLPASTNTIPAPTEIATASATPQSADFLLRPSEDSIRVMSYNVYWDSIFPADDPQNDSLYGYDRSAEFVRLLQAIQPDIACLQEINPKRDPQQVADIFDSTLPLENGEGWRAFSGEDNVIVSRWDLSLTRDDTVVHAGAINFGHATALVDLPDEEYVSDLYVLCTHFKASGGAMNEILRQRQADYIINWVRDLKTPGGKIDLPPNTPFLLMGDFNIYDTDPHLFLNTLLTGDIKHEDNYGPDTPPDWDNTDLGDAMPSHNALVVEFYTWRDDSQVYNPGPLDRVLYTDSVLAIAHAFILDTASMSAKALEEAGLEAGDVLLDSPVGNYDHLPLVVDFILLSP